MVWHQKTSSDCESERPPVACIDASLPIITNRRGEAAVGTHLTPPAHLCFPSPSPHKPPGSVCWPPRIKAFSRETAGRVWVISIAQEACLTGAHDMTTDLPEWFKNLGLCTHFTLGETKDMMSLAIARQRSPWTLWRSHFPSKWKWVDIRHAWFPVKKQRAQYIMPLWTTLSLMLPEATILNESFPACSNHTSYWMPCVLDPVVDSANLPLSFI